MSRLRNSSRQCAPWRKALAASTRSLAQSCTHPITRLGSRKRSTSKAFTCALSLSLAQVILQHDPVTRAGRTQVLQRVVNPCHRELLNDGGDPMSSRKGKHLRHSSRAAHRRTRNGCLSKEHWKHRHGHWGRGDAYDVQAPTGREGVQEACQSKSAFAVTRRKFNDPFSFSSAAGSRELAT
jgi:hypothetical protein